MKSLCCQVIAILFLSTLFAQAQERIKLTYDGKKWLHKGVAIDDVTKIENLEKAKGFELHADALTPMKVFEKFFKLWYILEKYDAKFVIKNLPNESVILKPLTKEDREKIAKQIKLRAHGDARPPNAFLISKDGISSTLSFDPAIVNHELKGLKRFLEAHKKEDPKKRVLRPIIFGEKLSFYRFTKSLQILKLTDTDSFFPIMGPKDPMGLIIKMDDNVKPSVAHNEDKSKVGRIVINVLKDGVFTTKAKKSLKNHDALVAHIKQEAQKLKAKGLTPKLHLRGKDDALFKNTQKAIKASGEAGVDQIVFSVYPFKEKKQPKEKAKEKATKKP